MAIGSMATFAGRLEAALLPTADDEGTTQSTADRILDAATRRFAEVGIGATTMSSIAPATATLIAETLTRLVGSTLIAPTGALDLHDPAVLRDYAARIVLAVVHAA